MSLTYSLAHQQEINNILSKWRLPLYFSKPVMNQLVHFIDGVMTRGFSGTLTDIHHASCHSRDRRTLSHFLAHGKWDERHLLGLLQQHVWEAIRQEARCTGEPIFVILDDTVCEKTKPSSQVAFAMQGTGFHHSHTKGQRVWGHAVVQLLLRCGDTVLPYSFRRYTSGEKSKIELACELVAELPQSSFPMYLLTDTWYPAQKVLDTASQTGCQVISGVKTNRIFYPRGLRHSLKVFAKYVHESDTDLVTVGEATYRVYRYEGNLNMMENAVVLLCWDANEPMAPEGMRAFVSTDVSLSTQQILCHYRKRWAIETYFRTMKSRFSLDRYQVRSTKSIDRFWTLVSFSAAFCALAGHQTILEGVESWQKKKSQSWIAFVYHAARAGESLGFIQKQLQAA